MAVVESDGYAHLSEAHESQEFCTEDCACDGFCRAITAPAGSAIATTDPTVRPGQHRKRQASREYAWFDRTDSGIIRPPWNRNLIGK
jgi:hypothetical protein